jgi:predicted transglutaminase-like cysteine proteinase
MAPGDVGAMQSRPLLAASLVIACQGPASEAFAAVGVRLEAKSNSAMLLKQAMPARSEKPNCAIAPAAGPISFSSAPSVSKSAAILGGATSKLDEMIRQQGGSQTAQLVPEPALLQPSGAFSCTAAPKLVQTSLPVAGPYGKAASYGANDFLNSKRLAISNTNFDTSWNRVASAKVAGSSRVRGMLRSAGGDRQALLASVNAWTNAKIRYVRDSNLYGQNDYWADAATTLRKRAGDCEDIAIVKMQLLAAAGVPMEDMNLTIAQDLARREAHALLVVRLNGRYVLLDDGTNELLDANAPLDYMPIMSFSADKKWLHGF